ncbi:MAG: 30S ribosomal protein S16 [Actinomycetaceae bacterium]|nr:30S ribosomal protein S16 [Actinomycetaceae bacterium]MDU0970129.1 30S ribosomal protein S16 [Actinomycetaceae bacterium]
MAVRIRLKRFGKIHYPVYRLVVVDSRKKRDGRVIEEVGQYNPNEQPSLIKVKSDRVQYWLGVGAQPSDAVHRLLVLSGDWAKFKGAKNQESRIQYKDAEAERAAKEEAVKAAAADAEKRKAAEAAAKEEARKAAEAEAKEAEAAQAESEAADEAQAPEQGEEA